MSLKAHIKSFFNVAFLFAFFSITATLMIIFLEIEGVDYNVKNPMIMVLTIVLFIFLLVCPFVASSSCHLSGFKRNVQVMFFAPFKMCTVAISITFILMALGHKDIMRTDLDLACVIGLLFGMVSYLIDITIIHYKSNNTKVLL
jgi:hypothetical protein